MIAINQDFLGIQGKRIQVVNDIEVWVRPVAPVVEGMFSYAIAWSSKRDDGAPYAVKTVLSRLGLLNEKGYQVEV